MLVTLTITFIAVSSFALFAWLKDRNKKERNELDLHSISAQDLHDFMASGRTALLFDVRQPLDLLAYPEMISGAQRIPPEEVLENPTVIPRDKDVVVYCTCPSDKTSRRVLRRALALGFSNIKFLKGGLAAWKGMGFPVEPYTGTFAFSSSATAGPKRR